MLSHIQLFVIPWAVAHQARLSMGFSRQEYWNRLPFPAPRYLLDPGIELVSPVSAGGFFTMIPPGKPKLTDKVSFMINATVEERKQVMGWG